MAKLVSKTYGDALFEVAVEEHKEALLYDEVQKLRQILKENKDFTEFMNHPKIPAEDKLQVVKNVFQGKVSDELTGFLVTVVEKKRFKDMMFILQYFIEKMKLHNSIGTVHVTTAIDITEDEKERIKQRLLETTTYKQLEMYYKTDEKIIGGIIIQIGDKVVDNSVRTKLSKLERELLAVQI